MHTVRSRIVEVRLARLRDWFSVLRLGRCRSGKWYLESVYFTLTLHARSPRAHAPAHLEHTSHDSSDARAPMCSTHSRSFTVHRHESFLSHLISHMEAFIYGGVTRNN